MKLAQLLLVEDETNVGSTLKERLEKDGHQVVWVQSVAKSIQELQSRSFDLVILDVGLPDGTGFDVAEWIRSHKRSIGILFLTAMSDSENRIRGLELGAEDYITKPFHLKELLLRLQNALKRSAFLVEQTPMLNEPILIGKSKVWFSKFEVETPFERVVLTHKECLLLKLLVENRGKVVSRDQILNQVWSEDAFPTPRTIDNFIARFRKWFEEDPESSKLFKSVRGVGYQLQNQNEEKPS